MQPENAPEVSIPIHAIQSDTSQQDAVVTKYLFHLLHEAQSFWRS